MRKALLIGIPFVLSVWGAAWALAADPGGRFLDAYFLIQDGDAAEAKRDWQRADAKFAAALEVLIEIKSQYPDWNSRIIEFRTNYCIGRREALKSKLIAPAPPAQQAAPEVSLPATAAPAAETAPTTVESNRIQQLTAELQESRDRIRQVEQDRDELKLKLEEALRKTAPPETATAEEAQKQIRALEAVRDALTAKLQETEAKAVQVETLKANLQQAQDRIQELEKSRADLNAKLQDALSKTAATQTSPQIDELLKKNADLASQLAAANNELAKLRELPPAPAEDQARLQGELDETKHTLAVTTQELTATRNELDAVRGENTKLKNSNEEVLTKLTETERQLRAAKSANEKNNEIIVQLQKENAQLREASHPAVPVTAGGSEEGVTSSGLRTELKGWQPGRRLRTKEQATNGQQESSTSAVSESGTSKLVATINAPGPTSATNAVAGQSAAQSQSASTKSAGKAGAARTAPTQFGPAPAQIKKVDDKYHFVVIDFSSRVMPPVGTRMTVYRNGEAIGEVQLTEPARTQFATADILSGDVQVGDEVR